MDNLKKEKIKTYIFVILVILLFAAFPFLKHHFTREKIKAFVESYQTLAPLVYIIAMIFLPIIGAPRLIMTAVGGALFTVFWGTVYAMIGSTLAGVLGYYLAYYSTANYFEAVTAQKHNRFISMLDFTKKNNFWLIFLSRVCPVTHYEVINYMCGTAKIPFNSFFWSTFLGIIPGTFIYVLMGDAMMDIMDKKSIGTIISELFSKDYHMLLQDNDVQKLLIVLLVLLVFLIVTMIGFYFIIKNNKKDDFDKKDDGDESINQQAVLSK